MQFQRFSKKKYFFKNFLYTIYFAKAHSQILLLKNVLLAVCRSFTHNLFDNLKYFRFKTVALMFLHYYVL
jgi:hypothetical protein